MFPFPLKVAACHSCTSGPVVDSMKYGSPIVAANNNGIGYGLL